MDTNWVVAFTPSDCVRPCERVARPKALAMKRAGSSSGPEATARRYKVEREVEIAGRERLEAQQGREKQREQSLLHEQLRSALDGLTPDEMQTFFAWREGEEPDPAT